MNAIIISALGSILEKVIAALIANRLHELNKIGIEEKKRIKKAINSALEEWLIAIFNNLKAQEYDDNDLRQFFEDYKKAIKIFLKDSEVAEELLKPFFANTTKYRIDSNLLMRRWIALT